MKILIVEDDVMVALSMDEALSDVGHIVVGLARDPAAAFRIVKESRPDLALVDLRLARDTSGAEVARHLRDRYGVPAVFVSGNPGDCKKVGFHIGALGCLAKPFTPDELVEAVGVAYRMTQQQSPERVPVNMELYYVV
jgi:DNA-binding response OmpR family regulator